MQSILLAYLVLIGERETDFTIMNTVKTAFFITYSLDFDPTSRSAVFKSIVIDKDYNITHVNTCPNIVGFIDIMRSVISVLKKNEYLTEDNKICGI